VLPPIGVVIKLPEMDELVDRASVGLEVAHELLVMTALLERREAELLVELRRFRHLADVECVRSQFVQRHQGFSFHRSLFCASSVVGAQLTSKQLRPRPPDRPALSYVLFAVPTFTSRRTAARSH